MITAQQSAKATAPVRRGLRWIWLLITYPVRLLRKQRRELEEHTIQIAQLFTAVAQHRDILTAHVQQIPHLVAVIEEMDARLRWYEEKVPSLRRQRPKWIETRKTGLAAVSDIELRLRTMREAAIREADERLALGIVRPETTAETPTSRPQ